MSGYWANGQSVQCRNSKFFLPLVLIIKVVQNIFFQGTYNASTFLSLDSRCAHDKWQNTIICRNIIYVFWWNIDCVHSFSHELGYPTYPSLSLIVLTLWILIDVPGNVTNISLYGNFLLTFNGRKRERERERRRGKISVWCKSVIDNKVWDSRHGIIVQNWRARFQFSRP